MRFLRYFAPMLLAGVLAACATNSGDDVHTGPPAGGGSPPLALFTASDFAFEPVPADRIVGADNYRPTGSVVHGSNEFHFVGKDCLRCHAAGQRAESVTFTMAGTVYKDLLGSEPLAGAEVVIVNSEGKVLSMTTNAAGNFMTQSVIEDSTGNATYKTWILDASGKRLPMVTMTSGSCNMHHYPLIRRGAMWAGSWSAAPEAAADPLMPVSYTEHVAPIFAAKCAPCHVPAHDTEKFLAEPLKGLPAGQGYDYTGGFDLVQYDSIIDDDAMPIESKLAPSGKPFLNFTAPGDSLLLAKMLAPETAHAGGKLAGDTTDGDYQTLLRWIEQGAPGPSHGP